MDKKMICKQVKGFFGKYLILKGDSDLDDECKYETTGLVSLHDAFSEKECNYEVLSNLISKLSSEGKKLEENEVNMDGWLLTPEYIYVDPPERMTGNPNTNNYRIRFIYYPGDSGITMEAGLKSLSEFIIEHVDYRDKRAVDMAYKFYLQVYRGDYVFDNV